MSTTLALQVTFILFVVYQLKHFIADFALQTGIEFFMRKFEQKGWAFPLFVHSFIHAAFSYCIVAVVCYTFVVLGRLEDSLKIIWLLLSVLCIDLIVHFTMDRIKASPNYLGRFKDINSRGFWWCLGLDQMVHHFTHYFIIYLTVMFLYQNVTG